MTGSSTAQMLGEASLCFWYEVGFMDMTYFAPVPAPFRERKDGRWSDYRLVAPAPGIDSILECDLAQGSELGDPDALTARIESGVAAFIRDIRGFSASWSEVTSAVAT